MEGVQCDNLCDRLKEGSTYFFILNGNHTRVILQPPVEHFYQGARDEIDFEFNVSNAVCNYRSDCITQIASREEHHRSVYFHEKRILQVWCHAKRPVYWRFRKPNEDKWRSVGGNELSGMKKDTRYKIQEYFI